MTVYKISRLLQSSEFPQLRWWMEHCLSGKCAKPYKSEWMLFQADSEHLYENISKDEFKGIMTECEGFMRDHYAHRYSPGENMQRFISMMLSERPKIPLKNSTSSPKYVTCLIMLRTFMSMIDEAPVKLRDVTGKPIAEENVINRISSPKEALAFSKELEDIGVKIGKDIRPGIFWVSDATRLDLSTYFRMDSSDLLALIEASGLRWSLGSDRKLDVVMVRIPFSDLPKWCVPTMFHSGISYFKPNEDARIDWGRTVDKRARSSKSGLPELIHSRIEWRRSFQVSYAGRITDEPIHYEENDWEKLLENSWNEREN